MNKIKANIQLICYAILAFFLFNPTILANNATTSLSGSNSAYINSNIDVTLYINTDSPIVAIQGTLNYDSSKLELVSQKSLAPFEVILNNNKIGGMDMTGKISITGKAQIIKLTFKTKQLGSTTISFAGNRQVGINGAVVSTTGCSKTININPAPSSNNNLSNLSISNANINFNKNNTNYDAYVNSNITSVSISATAEDSSANISGLGTKSLNYGKNVFKITVTAEDGTKKIYTVNITRQDSRSANNNLSSLKINDGTLNPSFDKNVTKYTLDVPYSVSSLNIDAKAEDSKSKINISGNNLIAEKSVDVVISVTAENGDVKNYIISVKRGKDPNKVLSNNNYLSYLKVDVGILSPIFDKDNIDYEVWLPYEIEKINFDYNVEDTTYAVSSLQGPDTLKPGFTNVYTIAVTAENNEVRTYTINVKRAKDFKENSNNTYLKEINIQGGKLTTSFDKDNYMYYYTRKKDFKLEAIPEDENSVVEIIENESNITIMVISSSGEYGVYTLVEKEFPTIYIFISILSFIIGIISGYVIKTVINSKKS